MCVFTVKWQIWKKTRHLSKSFFKVGKVLWKSLRYSKWFRKILNANRSSMVSKCLNHKIYWMLWTFLNEKNTKKWVSGEGTFPGNSKPQCVILLTGWAVYLVVQTFWKTIWSCDETHVQLLAGNWNNCVEHGTRISQEMECHSTDTGHYNLTYLLLTKISSWTTVLPATHP